MRFTRSTGFAFLRKRQFIGRLVMVVVGVIFTYTAHSASVLALSPASNNSIAWLSAQVHHRGAMLQPQAWGREAVTQAKKNEQVVAKSKAAQNAVKAAKSKKLSLIDKYRLAKALSEKTKLSEEQIRDLIHNAEFLNGPLNIDDLERVLLNAANHYEQSLSKALSGESMSVSEQPNAYQSVIAALLSDGEIQNRVALSQLPVQVTPVADSVAEATTTTALAVAELDKARLIEKYEDEGASFVDGVLVDKNGVPVKDVFGNVITAPGMGTTSSSMANTGGSFSTPGAAAGGSTGTPINDQGSQAVVINHAVSQDPGRLPQVPQNSETRVTDKPRKPGVIVNKSPTDTAGKTPPADSQRVANDSPPPVAQNPVSSRGLTSQHDSGNLSSNDFANPYEHSNPGDSSPIASGPSPIPTHGGGMSGGSPGGSPGSPGAPLPGTGSSGGGGVFSKLPPHYIPHPQMIGFRSRNDQIQKIAEDAGIDVCRAFSEKDGQIVPNKHGRALLGKVFLDQMADPINTRSYSFLRATRVESFIKGAVNRIPDNPESCSGIKKNFQKSIADLDEAGVLKSCQKSANIPGLHAELERSRGQQTSNASLYAYKYKLLGEHACRRLQISVLTNEGLQLEKGCTELNFRNPVGEALFGCGNDMAAKYFVQLEQKLRPLAVTCNVFQAKMMSDSAVASSIMSRVGTDRQQAYLEAVANAVNGMNGVGAGEPLKEIDPRKLVWPKDVVRDFGNSVPPFTDGSGNCERLATVYAAVLNYNTSSMNRAGTLNRGFQDNAPTAMPSMAAAGVCDGFRCTAPHKAPASAPLEEQMYTEEKVSGLILKSAPPVELKTK